MNIECFENIGIALNAPFQPAKWWTLDGYTSLYWNHYSGQVAGLGPNQPSLLFTSADPVLSGSGGWSAGLNG